MAKKPTVPAEIDNARIAVAVDAVHQSSVVLTEACERLSGYSAEEDFVLRALVARASALVDAAGVLLSYAEMEGETKVAEAIGAVHCG